MKPPADFQVCPRSAGGLRGNHVGLPNNGEHQYRENKSQYRGFLTWGYPQIIQIEPVWYYTSLF